MRIEMNDNDDKERRAEKSERLQTLFSLLTGETQTYVLGLAEGLKAAQERVPIIRSYGRKR